MEAIEYTLIEIMNSDNSCCVGQPKNLLNDSFSVEPLLGGTNKEEENPPR